MTRRTFISFAAVVLAGIGAIGPAAALDRFIVVQSTTSTQNSGLYDHILPKFTDRTGIEVRVVAVGTGQAIRNAANGDGDVLLVHAKPAEEKFVADGYGVARFALMYNDFVIVGPPADPAGVAGMTDAVAALAKIAGAGAPFASRGDDSGTHKAELGLWAATGVDVEAASGGWYRETGSGMGATLNIGIGMGAYVLTDRATWLSFGNKGRAPDRGRGRSQALQPVRNHPGEPREAPEREGRPGPAVHRLDAVGGRPGRDRFLPRRRPAAILPQREKLTAARTDQAPSLPPPCPAEAHHGAKARGT